MQTTARARRWRWSTIIAIATVTYQVGIERAEAQGFISPFIGYNFGGDAQCPQITDCEDKHANWGASFGVLGSLFGFEAEVAYTDQFFGKSSNQSSKVLTFVGNLMLAPRIGPVQPYGLGGLGLLRTSVEGGGTTTDQNQFGWDAGGGVVIFFAQHFGLRGDVRYFHAFQALDFHNLPPSLPIADRDQKRLDFARVIGALVFKF